MELRTEVEIAAPADRVWRVLTDFPAYPEWNPFITRISGKLEVGSRLLLTMSLPEGKAFELKPTLLKCEPEGELRWRGKLFVRGLFDGEHFFKLQELGPGQTRVVHGEDFSGILVQRMGDTLTRTARGFVYMNNALKRRLESLST
jgi:hypothetical protein